MVPSLKGNCFVLEEQEPVTLDFYKLEVTRKHSFSIIKDLVKVHSLSRK